ncbi:hypothetical protein LOK49_LG09G01781 [Camellia lanceoleosa]|uniref:Uncharacterized protein n=1 Tax=Camellia lanceoleosa TaxID=1840588 RepID=A0ACC0GH97_9ERIC|nr:hypothetical protein LOK49_LG09G01781 [Camellia lanceoleosa]
MCVFFLSLIIVVASIREIAQTGGTPGTQNNMGLELLMNVFGGLGAGGLNLPNTPDGKNFIAFLCKVFLISLPFSPLLKANMSLFFIVPPEELYATQLSQL